jgi:O-antigen ligase
MLFKCVLAYVVVFYSQIGARIPLLESLRPELVLGSLILIAIGTTWKQTDGAVGRTASLNGSIMFLFVAMALSIPGSYWITKSVETMVVVFKMFSLYIMIMATIDTEAKLRQFMWVYAFMVALIVGEPFIGVFTGSATWDDHRGYPKLMGMTGLWAHPNSLGGFAAANLAFLYYLFVAEQQKMKKYLLLGLGIMSLATIVLTGSRTAYVGVVGIVFIIWLRSARKGLSIVVLIAGMALTWIVAPQAYKDQFLSIGSIGDVVQGERIDDGSMNERWQIVTDAMEIFLDHPIFGVGVDAFMTARGERFDRWQDTHNLYLQILTNVGIVGLIAFMSMLHSIFQSLRKAKQLLHQTQTEHSLWLENLANAVGVFLSARLIVGMFGMDFYENYWWLAAGLAGVLLRLAATGHERQVDTSGRTLARSEQTLAASDAVMH